MILIPETKDVYVQTVRKEEFTSFFYLVICGKCQHSNHIHELHECITQVCTLRLVAQLWTFFVVRNKDSNLNGHFNSTNKDPIDLRTYRSFPNSVFFNT